MNKSTEIKKILRTFNNIASDVMNIKHDTGKAPLISLKNFIETNKQISDILKEIRENCKTAEDFYTTNKDTIYVVENVNELEFLKSSYKLLCEDCEDKTDLKFKCIKIYWQKGNYNDSINKYLKTAYFPLIRYVQTKLEEMIMDFEDEEKQNVSESNKIEIKQEGGKGNKVKINKSQSKQTNFVFHKESFWLGVLGGILSGVAVWLITEFILKLI